MKIIAIGAAFPQDLYKRIQQCRPRLHTIQTDEFGNLCASFI